MSGVCTTAFQHVTKKSETTGRKKKEGRRGKKERVLVLRT